MSSLTHVAFPVAARSKAWVCGCSLAGIVGSNPAGGIDVCCECRVLSGGGGFHSTRSPTECGVCECDRGTSQERYRPSRAVGPREQNCPHILLTDIINNVISLNDKDYYKDRLVFVMAMQWVSLRRQIIVIITLYPLCHSYLNIQGGSNMTWTDVARFTHKQFRSYLNHIVLHVFRYLYQAKTL